MTREDFEDTVLYDKTGKYFVAGTLVSIQYFLKNKKMAYFNNVSKRGEHYNDGIEISAYLMSNLTMENAPF